MERMTTMLSIAIILFLILWGIIFWINKIIKKPTIQTVQGGGNQNTTNTTAGTGTTNPAPAPRPARTPTNKFSLWNIIVGLLIIVLLVGFIVRMNTSYSQKITLKKGQDYTFDVYNERVVINPQVHCVHVIYPDHAEYTFCPSIPVNAGEHGVGLYRLQATSDSQIVIISKKPLTFTNKLGFWIRPTNWNLLFD